MPNAPIDPLEHPDQSLSQGVLSTIVEGLAAEQGRERLSVQDLLDRLGDRAQSTLVFIFAAPNVLPIGVPGMSMVLGLPLFFLTWRMMTGRSGAWLPASIGAKSFNHADFVRAVDKVLPWLQRLEAITRPRFRWLSGAFAQRVFGGVGVILSVIISLPIPFGNALPGATLAVLSLGLVERDGIVIAIGVFATVLSFSVTGFILWSLGSAGLWLLGTSL